MNDDLLELSGVGVGYGDGVVLTDVDVRVAVDRVVCLLGRNGVGKTTLLKTIMGLLQPRVGDIVFGRHDLMRMTPHARARLGIGYVPQGRLIFPQLSVRENLLVGMEALAGRGPDALGDVLDLFPVLDEMAHRRAGLLSGGQQQQLAIGRALVSRPRLLVLDEPTEGLQPSLVLEIRRALRTIREATRVAILIAEQFLEFGTELADEVYVLDAGGVALRGPRASLDRAAVNELLAV